MAASDRGAAPTPQSSSDSERRERLRRARGRQGAVGLGRVAVAVPVEPAQELAQAPAQEHGVRVLREVRDAARAVVRGLVGLREHDGQGRAPARRQIK